MILNSSIVNAAIFACKIFLKTALYQGFFRPFIIDKTLFLLYVLLVFKGLRYGFASKSMVESKNLKLKLGLCGLALTSFLALNSRSVVHADTVSGSNAGAITWDSDQDDSQVVHEDSQQEKLTQSVQTQGAVQSAPATQSVQSNNQKRAETSTVRVSNFDTSAVNRNNAQNARNNANVKVATVHDTAQMPVQKTKVAQFNQGSKIYTLNGSNQLSKNNGDGYVITNAGMYNGRAVDIGVTINNVQDNQGTYTTKWSNGDSANVTGRTDANFKYQDSVLLNQQQDNVTVPNQTRNRPQRMTTTQQLHGFYMGVETMEGAKSWVNYVDPGTLARALAMQNIKATDYKAVRAMAGRLLNMQATDVTNGFSLAAQNGGYYEYNNDTPYMRGNIHDTFEIFTSTMDDTGHIGVDVVNQAGPYVPSLITDSQKGPNDDGVIFLSNPTKYTWDQIVARKPDLEPYKNDFNKDNVYTYQITSNESVTDHLQLANKTDASLNYNYTVGLYDAQTGDLITDLKAEYKGKTGVQATASTNVMNSAIKNKIQQINQGKATVSYTGTKANDDVAFYQETRQVNPQDKNVNRQVQRVIHINFPNGKKPASYDNITDSAGNKLTLDSNNNLTQSMSFTRTGVQNIVSGHVTYGNWQQHGAINAVTLPAIPGYTMTQTK